MRESGNMYGREFEMSWLNSKLFPANNPFGVPPLVLLYGTSGCGVTFLARALIQNFREKQEESPLLIFTADSLAGNASVSEFSQSLILSAEFSRSDLQSELLNLRGNFKVQYNEQKKELSSATEEYNLDGSVRSVPLSETHLAGDPEGYVLASISVDSIDQLFTRILGEANPSLAGLRFLYVFDDYPKYSPQVKRWIGGPLLERFSQASHLPPPGFLLTGSEAWDASGQKDYWQKNPGTFFDLEVMPLDRESCTQWLQDFDLPIAYIDCLMEESEGIPARVKPLVERPGALEKLVKEGAKAQDFPYPASAQQRRWLHAAAMADFVSEESLLLLLGKAEGRKALEWFAASAPIDLVTVSVMAGVAHIHMRSDFRDKVFNLCMEKVPARHREFLYKFDLHTRISEKVPLPEDRDSLRLLSPVQPFNPKILTTLFGRDE